MQSPVEGSPSQVKSQVLARRTFLKLAGSTSTLLLLTACGGGAAPAAPPAATQEPVAMRTLVPAALPTQAPAAAPAAPTTAPAAPAPTAAPAVTRAEPKGRLTTTFQTTLSPSWLDPQENPPQVTPYNFAYCLHDALVKHMPDKLFAPSLAESYELPPDFKSATFKLRPGVKFHDGSPVTPEDVKFTYEQYRGASSTVLKAKLDRIETPDDRTVRFLFKEPFVDFLMLYGSPASGAGWIIPKAYYEKVGKDGFKNAPIGAGPFRFVKQVAGSEMEFEAVPDYWRKAPNVKTVVIKGVPEMTTRVALLKTGEVDAAHQLQGVLLQQLRKEGTYRLGAVRSAATWLELGALDSPDHPLKDLKVRQAVSLAIDRQAINEAELDGMSPIEGNWVPEDYQGAVKRPVQQVDLAQAKKLLAEAGVADGFEVSALTPLPPYFSWAERIISQLRAVNIKTQVNTMERAAFYDKLAPGPNRQKGLVLQFSGAPGDAAARIRENAVCKGAFSGLCLPEVDERMQKFEASVNPQERQQLLEEVQNFLLDQYYMIPMVRNVAVWGFGPRIANKIEEINGSISQYPFLGPWEDIQVKD